GACEFESDDPLSHAEDLCVVRQHGALHGVDVVRRDRAHALDLVRGDGHPKTRAADQQGSIRLTGGDLLRGGDRDVRVVGLVLGTRDADIDDRVDAVVRLEVLLAGVLAVVAGVVTADEDPQDHRILLVRTFHAAIWGGFSRNVASASTSSENDTAPGSGVPRLLAPRARERPRRAVMSAVCWAAGAAASAAARAAAATSPLPANASRRAAR